MEPKTIETPGVESIAAQRYNGTVLFFRAPVSNVAALN